MAYHKSSFLCYEGTLEWHICEPRDCLEFGTTNYTISKQTPDIEFSMPLQDVKRSCGIFWNIRVYTSGTTLDDKPAFRVYVNINTKGNVISKKVGLKSSLSILSDANDMIIEGTKNYFILNATTCNKSISEWLIPLEKISRTFPFIKLICTLQAYDMTEEIIITTPSITSTSLTKESQLQCSNVLALMLDKDRKEGSWTDAILKHMQHEYKVHKCVLAVQSEFFKALFSDRWEGNEESHVVDMNDSDITPEILEALISGAYTGKIEDFEIAMKVLPVIDKYQFIPLKKVCESVIGRHISKDNVLMIHSLAEQCDAKDLKRRCQAVVKM